MKIILISFSHGNPFASTNPYSLSFSLSLSFYLLLLLIINHYYYYYYYLLLSQIGLTEVIELNKKSESKIIEGSWRDPLKNLTEELRIHIAKFYYYLSINWLESGEFSKYFKEEYDMEYLSFKTPSKKYPIYYESIRKGLLDQLNLPQEIIDELPQTYLPISPSIQAIKALEPQFHWAILWQILLQSLLNVPFFYFKITFIA